MVVKIMRKGGATGFPGSKSKSTRKMGLLGLAHPAGPTGIKKLMSPSDPSLTFWKEILNSRNGIQRSK